MLRFARAALAPKDAYQAMLSSGKLRSDDRQRAVVAALDRVHADFCAYQKRAVPRPTKFTNVSAQGASNAKLRLTDRDYHPLSNVKGLYIFGGVGTGKTALMDIAYNEFPTMLKKRVHFHSFMLDVHKTLHDVKLKARASAHEAMDECVLRLSRNAEVLCFDEMVVHDIADAMVMKRLFDGFYRVGIVSIVTSNRAPQDLYSNGLNREQFTPFIDLISSRCDILDINSNTDYRLTGSVGDTYLAPINDDNKAKFDKLFLELCKYNQPQQHILRVFGRDIYCPRTFGGVCHFTFQEINASEMGSADFNAIAKTFHTFFLEDVPKLKAHQLNQIKRFVTLLDELYQYRVKLVILAAAEPMELHDHDPMLDMGSVVQDMTDLVAHGSATADDTEETFQWQRAVSRLCEMRSKEYLENPHIGVELDLSLGE